MHIEEATEKHVSEVGRLFDLYRQLYECDADLALATNFISERVANSESTIFVAMDGDKALGFVHISSAVADVTQPLYFSAPPDHASAHF